MPKRSSSKKQENADIDQAKPASLNMLRKSSSKSSSKKPKQEHESADVERSKSSSTPRKVGSEIDEIFSGKRKKPEQKKADEIFSGGPYIDILVPNHRLLINNSLAHRNGTRVVSVLVNQVWVSVSHLFLESNIAVHGLDGIIVAGFDDRVEDTSFEGATSSLVDEIWSAELNSPPAGRTPARRRNGRNERQNRRNSDKRAKNRRGRSFNSGRGGAGNVGGGTCGDGVSHSAFARFNHH